MPNKFLVIAGTMLLGACGVECTELSDRAVEAAGEHMLNETYPELLKD